MDNPAFQHPPGGITAERTRMMESPSGLERPLVVVAGWRTPALTAGFIARDLALLTGAEPQETRTVGVMLCNSMAAAVQRLVSTVEQSWPSDDPTKTIEVDVVAISMGGLITRAAALPDDSGQRKQLDVRRLFTLGTPHRGASLANRIAIDPPARDMRTGSTFLGTLDEAIKTSIYELVCYARTRDFIVGATNTAPPGHEPHWLPGPIVFSHVTIWADPLIRLDIARRLRNEEPLAGTPSPPPRD